MDLIALPRVTNSAEKSRNVGILVHITYSKDGNTVPHYNKLCYVNIECNANFQPFNYGVFILHQEYDLQSTTGIALQLGQC